MATAFIGGSRRIARFDSSIEERMDRMIQSGHQTLIGDADAPDEASQKHLHEREYSNPAKVNLSFSTLLLTENSSKLRIDPPGKSFSRIARRPSGGASLPSSVP